MLKSNRTLLKKSYISGMLVASDQLTLHCLDTLVYMNAKDKVYFFYEKITKRVIQTQLNILQKTNQQFMLLLKPTKYPKV